MGAADDLRLEAVIQQCNQRRARAPLFHSSPRKFVALSNLVPCGNLTIAITWLCPSSLIYP